MASLSVQPSLSLEILVDTDFCPYRSSKIAFIQVTSDLHVTKFNGQCPVISLFNLLTVLWSLSSTSWRLAHILTWPLLWPPPCPPTQGPVQPLFTSSASRPTKNNVTKINSQTSWFATFIFKQLLNQENDIFLFIYLLICSVNVVCVCVSMIYAHVCCSILRVCVWYTHMRVQYMHIYMGNCTQVH